MKGLRQLIPQGLMVDAAATHVRLGAAAEHAPLQTEKIPHPYGEVLGDLVIGYKLCTNAAAQYEGTKDFFFRFKTRHFGWPVDEGIIQARFVQIQQMRPFVDSGVAVTQIAL